MGERAPPGGAAGPAGEVSFQVPADRVPPVGARMMLAVFRRPDAAPTVDGVPSETGHWVVTHTEATTTPGGMGTGIGAATVYVRASQFAG
jgi:hypothetical protein